MAGRYIEGSRRVNNLNTPGGLDRVAEHSSGRQVQNVIANNRQLVVTEVIATNYLLHTNSFSNAVWTKEAGVEVVLSDSVKTISGNAFATRVTNAVIGRQLHQTSADSFSVSDKLWFTVWMKAAIPYSVTIKLQNQGNVTIEQEICTLDTEWQSFELPHLWSGVGAGRVILELNTVGECFVYGPQLHKGTNNFRMYIPSTATKGTYSRLITKKRLVLYEDTTLTEACPIKETPDANTAIAVEQI